MSKKLKTVYIPTKVEDELPEINKMVFTFTTMIPGKVKYPPEDDGENININCRVSEIPNKCEQWYDEHNFNMTYSKVNSWLKPTQLITFTLEEYNQHIQDVIKDALDTAAEMVDLIETDGDPDPESITNTLEQTFKKENNMIQANEYRIGNLVTEEYVSYSGIKSRYIKIASNNITNHCNFSPIPLTEDILLKCGFVKHKACIGGCDMWQGMDGWSLGNNEWLFRGNPTSGLKLVGYWNTNIHHLHQLQNLFFCLCGEELEIKL